MQSLSLMYKLKEIQTQFFHSDLVQYDLFHLCVVRRLRAKIHYCRQLKCHTFSVGWVQSEK